MHEVEFPYGKFFYVADDIAYNIWAHVDLEGQRYVIFELIIDHQVEKVSW